jgi:hypothetical protein
MASASKTTGYLLPAPATAEPPEDAEEEDDGTYPPEIIKPKTNGAAKAPAAPVEQSKEELTDKDFNKSEPPGKLVIAGEAKESPKEPATIEQVNRIEDLRVNYGIKLKPYFQKLKIKAADLKGLSTDEAVVLTEAIERELKEKGVLK